MGSKDSLPAAFGVLGRVAVLGAALALGGCFGSSACSGPMCDDGPPRDAGATDSECNGVAVGSYSNSTDQIAVPGGDSRPRPLAALTGVRALDGIVSLRGAKQSDLEPLRCLEELDGLLIIRGNPELTDLSGLERLRAVDQLEIIDNGLTSLRGLAQDLIDDDGILVVERLEVSVNPSLSEVEGLLTHLETPDLRMSQNQFKSLPALARPEALLRVDLRENGLVDLGGLNGLSELDDVHIEEHGLTDLSELSALRRVDRLEVVANGLTDLTGLDKLAIVEGGLSIEGQSMTSLRGLDSLTQVVGDLDLSHLPKLEDLSGLERITRVGSLRLSVLGDVFVSDGPRSLHGLENLKEVLGDVDITTNNSLQTLQGLGGLERIDGTLQIAGNRDLVDLQGVESLQTVGADLTILGNESLTTLQGFGSELVVGRLLVFDNATLPVAEANALARRLGRACLCELAIEQDCECSAPCECTD